MRNDLRCVAVALSLVVVAASCRRDGRETAVPTDRPSSAPRATAAAPSTQAQPRGQARRHALQDQRLRTMMQQIGRLNAALPEGMPQDVESPAGGEARAAAKDVATAAGDLARTALTIPDAVADAPLSEADRRAFAAEAQTLHDQAIRLRDEARQFQVERMQRTMDGIASTCISCHSRFRDLSGELDFRKAASSPLDPGHGPSARNTP